MVPPTDHCGCTKEKDLVGNIHRLVSDSRLELLIIMVELSHICVGSSVGNSSTSPSLLAHPGDYSDIYFIRLHNFEMS